jgi:putative nucleotidyltransferase with HDIG domain
MNPTLTFLTALGQALAAQSLYGDDHPMRQAGAARVLQALTAVLRDGTLRLSFLDNEVIAGSRAVTELRGWEWGGKLSAAGVQRLEIGPVPVPTAADVSAMLGALRDRLNAPGMPATTWARAGIRLGPLTVAVTEAEDADEQLLTSVVDALAFAGLGTEVAAVDYIHAEVESGRPVPMAEVDGIVRALSVAIRQEQGCLLPLLDIRTFDEYTTTHCCNVAMLSMGICDQLGVSDADTRAIGTAALLHDIGKTRIPHGLLTKPGKLTDDERKVMQRHPEEGARILTARGLGHSLAATVAYEHHIWFNGQGGYPRLSYPRGTHYASRIVHVSDIYDAISSKRPYHNPFPRDKALELIGRLAGVELDPHIAAAFLTMAAGATEFRHLVDDQPSLVPA